jgi:hypothetical protein
MRFRRVSSNQSASGAVTAAGVLALCCAALVAVVAIAFILFWPPIASLRSEISGAFAESASASSSGRYDWECRWGCESENWISSLPPLSKVTCYDHLAGHGACCGAVFDGGSFRLYSEIHVFRLGSGHYKISFYSYPMCTTPGFDLFREPDLLVPQEDPFFPCDERWRT